MPRRRLSERQLKRIQAIQERRREQRDIRAEEALSEGDGRAPQTGLVVVRHGANLAVEHHGGEVFHCVTRRHVGDPVCGDRVIWQQTDTGNGVVTAIEPRQTELSRPGYGGRIKPLAANLTQIAVVIAPEPPPTGDLLDQYLIAAETIGVAALLVCNKTDLLTGPGGDALMDDLAAYQRLGYPLVRLNNGDQSGLAALRDQLHHHTSILVGQSGVGKSSLADALLPDQQLQVGRLSRATGLGRHTTSAATCYRLPTGGHLIDSPGVRSFRPPLQDRAMLEQGFIEFRPYLGHCRFPDCRHASEPDCAIQAGLASGDIDQRRLRIFHRLLDQIESSSLSA